MGVTAVCARRLQLVAAREEVKKAGARALELAEQMMVLSPNTAPTAGYDTAPFVDRCPTAVLAP